MKRIDYQRLLDRAFLTRNLVEYDDELGIAVVKIGREKFYANVPATPEWVAPVAAEGGAA